MQNSFGATVLIVDDDEIDRTMLQQVLDHQGYATLAASNGAEAISLAQQTFPDLILLDLFLPDMAGFAVCELLKAVPQTHDIPILFVSGSDRLDHKKKAFAVGGVDYITKPFQIEEIFTRIQTHLTIRQLQKRLEQKNAQLEQELGDRRRREGILRSFAVRLQTLHEIDQSILAAHSPETIAVAAVGRIRQLVPCQRVIVIEVDEDGQCKTLAAESSGDLALATDVQSRQCMLEESLLRQGNVLGVGDLDALSNRSSMQQMLYDEGVRSYIVAPLMVQEELGGTLHLEARASNVFNHEHVTAIIEIAALLAIAIRQVRLYDLAQQEILVRQAAEAALRAYTAELEASNAELDAFAHTVAHDLKTPLTALIGYSLLLERRYDRISPEQVHDGLHVITQNAQKMDSIIDELLLLASVRKLDDIKISPLNMSTVVEQVRERLFPLIDERQAELVLPERWPVALGYGPWIEEVWANYISNAIKYGGSPPHIELGADEDVEQASDSGPVTRFWVRDNGDGIPLEQQEQLFGLFTRLDRDAKVEGHGLGLSIVRRIINKLGGKVGVESEVGQGSRFYFTLPIP
ncbi:MAG: response regulator [Anaerolineae bacterium]|nr:response regulator [Anaerolineae bacterium]